MTRARFQPAPLPPFPVPRGPELFGIFTLEVVTPGGVLDAPLLPDWPLLADWEVRAWPVARLGDATLEARPRRAGLDAADLQRDLRRAGYLPLGPVRARRSLE